MLILYITWSFPAKKAVEIVNHSLESVNGWMKVNVLKINAVKIDTFLVRRPTVQQWCTSLLCSELHSL